MVFFSSGSSKPIEKSLTFGNSSRLKLSLNPLQEGQSKNIDQSFAVVDGTSSECIVSSDISFHCRGEPIEYNQKNRRYAKRARKGRKSASRIDDSIPTSTVKCTFVYRYLPV